MLNKELHYESQGISFLPRLISESASPKPAVLVAPTFAGMSEFALDQAKEFAKLGYTALILDLYGQGRTSQDAAQCREWMGALNSDRSYLKDRLRAAFRFAREQPEVDPDKIAVVGFCFGGLCALDMARSGIELKAAISFHGILSPSPISNIKAKVLVLHGYEDPLANPDQLRAFAEEMTGADVDWQVHAYGHTGHSFTNPKVNNKSEGYFYDEKARDRSMRAATGFLEEVFTQEP